MGESVQAPQPGFGGGMSALGGRSGAGGVRRRKLGASPPGNAPYWKTVS
jgi:hypothetical protein